MSESHAILADIVQDRAAGTTDPVLNLRSGATFTAEIEGNLDPIVIAAELDGADTREVVLLHVTSAQQAAGILRNDLVKFTLFGQTVTHKIIKRRENAGSPQTDFWAAKVYPNKDK